MSLADPDWEDGRIVNGLSTGEGLIWQVRDPITKESIDKKSKKKIVEIIDAGVADKRLCVLEPEFARVLRVMSRQGNTLSGVVRQAWETGRIMSLTKNSPGKATGAHVSAIAHTTKDELIRNLDNVEIANGLANRFLFALVRRSKLLPFGGEDIDFGEVGAKLAQSIAYARTAKRVELDGAAKDLWGETYEALTSDTPGLAGAIVARAAPIVLRLALLFAMADRAYRIGEPHLQAALALWRYSEASVCLIFGEITGDPVTDAILPALKTAGAAGMSRWDLSNMLGRNVHSSRIQMSLDMLHVAGKVRRDVVSSGPGRPTEMWFAR